MNQNEIFLKKVEQFIQIGKFVEAKKMMSAVSRSQLQPSQILKLAQLMRRSDHANLGLVLLRPLMNFKVQMSPEHLQDVQIEYAACMIKRGVIAPAMRILEKFDAEKFPKILLFQSFGLFAEWNYQLAIPLLQQYCQSGFITKYEQTVGKVNLAAAYLGTSQATVAERELDLIIPWLKSESHFLLLGNCYELMAQAKLQNGQYKQAEQFVEEAEKIFGHEKSRHRLTARKWELILNAKQNKISPAEISENFWKFRQEALERNDFETVRDSEAWLACLLQDKEQFRKVYFGSSFKGYRQNLLKMLGSDIELQKSYSLQVGEGADSTSINFFDIGDISEITKAVLQLLCSDFYRPFSVGRIFNHLFPFDLFDPIQDTHRIYEIVRRTNFWLRSQKYPISVVSSKYGYKLSSSKKCELQVPIDAALVSECFEKVLIRKSDKKSFSAKEVCEWTGTPLTTVIRKLNGLISSGYLLKLNSGRKTRYCWQSFFSNSTNIVAKAS